jgi:LuxR family transcriptional regulator, positive regulator of biofilm formation
MGGMTKGGFAPQHTVNNLGEGARMLRDILIQKGLSNRESEVAELVTKGLSNKEVANQLFVTEKTVKFHLTNIYKKMNVKSRAQLIVWCLPHMGFVEKEERAPSQEIRAVSPTIIGGGQQQAQNTTIPAGNATVGGAINIPRGNGNNDLGL